MLINYAAFISYSSTDRSVGEGLQKALEAYVVPAPLRGQDFGHGPVPKRMAPLFRDRWDANASTDLGATLRAALLASQALIVLCSPASARSIWVGEEIREFKRLGRAERIFPVLIAGLPDRFDAQAQPQGAFHPALFESWRAADESWQADNREPLAPDLRPEGDGLPFAVLKLVAALTGLSLTTLTQRQAQAERRERNVARWVAGGMAVLALGAGLGAWASWRASNTARERLEGAIEMAARRVDDAASYSDRYGVPSGVILELLDGAGKDFEHLTADAPNTPTLLLQRARLERKLADHYEAVGEGNKHGALAQRSLTTMAAVPTQRSLAAPATWWARLPAAQAVNIERLQSMATQAAAQTAQGDKAGAAATLEQLAQQADSLLQASEDPKARSLAAQARSLRARLFYEAGDLEAALQRTQEATRVLTGGGPAHDILELARMRSDEAETLLELGRHDQALQVQVDVVKALSAVKAPASPAGRGTQTSPEARRALAAAIARQGDMRLAAHRDLAQARADYLQAQGLLKELLAEDGARTDIKRDLSLTFERAGDADLQGGNLAQADAAFASCLALRRELVARDRGNAEWRRDLSVALERVAGVQALLGRHRDAQMTFDEALQLRQAAWAEQLQDMVATRDLAVLWMRMGQSRAQAPTGARVPASQKLAGIDTAYAKAISLLNPLVQTAAADSRWRRDLAVAHAERGDARLKAGQLASARDDFNAALTLIEGLRKTDAQDGQLIADEAWLRKRLRRW